MTKADQFFTNFNRVVENLDRTEVLETIGDTTNTNRTLSVSQVIRFLTQSSKRSHQTLGTQLSTVYSLVRPVLAQVRPQVNRRSDSFDIKEFEYGFILAQNYVQGFNRSISRRLR